MFAKDENFKEGDMMHNQVLQVLMQASSHMKNGEYQKILQICETALTTLPNKDSSLRTGYDYKIVFALIKAGALYYLQNQSCSPF